MPWYYADNNERRGPIDDAAFDALVRAGSIRPDTLVWREGMPAWLAFSEAGHQAAPMNVPPPVPPAAGPAPGVEMGVCSESGRTLPRSELVEIDGRLVSAEYKHIVLQRIREGVSTGGSGEDPEQLGQRILERDWHIKAGACVSRGWSLIKERFWLTTGATFIIYLLVMASSIIPFGQIIVQGPLFGGLYWMLLKLLRGQPASLEDAFQGFKRGWGHLIGASIIGMLVMFACMVPGLALFFMSLLPSTAEGAGMPFAGGIPPLAIVGGLLAFAGVCAGTYFVVAWIFAMPLIVDKRFEMWPAMKLSRLVVGMHWWRIFWLLLFTSLVIMALLVVGMLIVGLVVGLVGGLAGNQNAAVALGIVMGLGLAIGFFAVLPLAFSALMVAYEEIFAPSLPRT